MVSTTAKTLTVQSYAAHRVSATALKPTLWEMSAWECKQGASLEPIEAGWRKGGSIPFSDADWGGGLGAGRGWVQDSTIWPNPYSCSGGCTLGLRWQLDKPMWLKWISVNVNKSTIEIFFRNSVVLNWMQWPTHWEANCSCYIRQQEVMGALVCPPFLYFLLPLPRFEKRRRGRGEEEAMWRGRMSWVRWTVVGAEDGTSSA